MGGWGKRKMEQLDASEEITWVGPNFFPPYDFFVSFMKGNVLEFSDKNIKFILCIQRI